MSKQLVPLFKNPRLSVRVDPDATVGATVGVDFRLPDGTVPTLEQLIELFATPPASGQTVVYWRFIKEIPPNLVALAETATTGLYTITGAGTSATREIVAGNAGITVLNGTGVAGNPAVSHAATGGATSIATANAGVNVLQNLTITYDSFGHASVATVSSVNLAGSFEPAITAGTTAQFWRGDKTFTNNLVGPIYVGASGTTAAVYIGYGTSGVNTCTTVGRQAQEGATGGANCVFLGYQAGRNATGGSENTVLGAQAMGSGITTGDDNVAVGYRALFVCTSGNGNVAIGAQALDANLGGSSNIAVGTNALGANVSGSNNMAMGISALLACTADNNVGIGTTAASLLVSGNRNVNIGTSAGNTGTTANANVSGSDNTFVGFRAGPGTTTQLSFATALGSTSLVTTSNTVALGRTTDNTIIGATGDTGGGCKLQVTGHIGVLAAGNGLRVAEGSNAKQGVATLVAGTVVVANTAVTANSRIFLTHQNNGGVVGFVTVSARTAGTNFTILSSSALDTSIIAYEIFEPAT